MALTGDQLYMLTSLAYLDDSYFTMPSDDRRLTVQEILSQIDSAIEGDKFPDISEKGEMTKAQMQGLVERIRGDETLCSMEISATTRLVTNGREGARTFCAVAGNGETAVIFEGSSGVEEWADNFRAGYEEVNPHLAGTPYEGTSMTDSQLAALAWYQSLKDSGAIPPGAPVSVAGHSKGGNAAQTLTLFNPEIETCANFDGQGFSDAFVRQFTNQIADAKHKITTYAEACDFVNILMNSIAGETHYIQAADVSSPFYHHNLHSIDPTQGLRAQTVPEQSALMVELNAFLNSYLRSNATEKEATLKTLGYIIPRAEKGDSLSLSGILKACGYEDCVLGFLELAMYARMYFADRVEEVFGPVLPALVTVYKAVKILSGSNILGKKLAEWLLLDVIPQDVYNWIAERLGLDSILAEALFQALRQMKGYNGLTLCEDVADIEVVSSYAYQKPVLRVDTDQLREAAVQLRNAAGRLNGEAQDAKDAGNFCDNHTIFAVLTLSAMPLQTILRKALYQSIPSIALNTSARHIQALADKMTQTAALLDTMADNFETVEQELIRL